MQSSTEVFFRTATFWARDRGSGTDAPPVFLVDGIHYCHVRAGGLWWVATTRSNVSPSMVIELLLRMGALVRDYVGTASEDAVRRNFLLVYELLDEVMDYGFPQNSSTERLKQFVAMEPMVVRPRARLPGSIGGAHGPAEVVKSVLDTRRTGAREEIFVDIVEKLTAVFDAGGRLRSSSIVGSIQVKSYLAGDPAIRVGLNEGLLLGGKGAGSAGSGPGHESGGYSYSGGAAEESVALDTYSLHASVDQQRFGSDAVLELVPPEGHFVLMHYRSSKGFRPPFRVYPLLEADEVSPGDKLTLYVRLRAEFDADRTASGVEVAVPLPAAVTGARCETGEYSFFFLFSFLSGGFASTPALYGVFNSRIMEMAVQSDNLDATLALLSSYMGRLLRRGSWPACIPPRPCHL
jgi:AP-4 complex subunit mu-1